MRALITGAEGFAGGHLIRHLTAHHPDLEVHGAVFREEAKSVAHLSALASITQIDLCDSTATWDLIGRVRPDFIFHLAAQAFVPRSFEAPWETLENNIKGQLNLTLALLGLELNTRMLVVSSAEVYGNVPPDQMPLTEAHALMPVNPYSVSKVGQDMLGLQYYLSHNMSIVRVRPFNHIGPGSIRIS